jgi:hypothetical protein
VLVGDGDRVPPAARDLGDGGALQAQGERRHVAVFFVCFVWEWRLGRAKSVLMNGPKACTTQPSPYLRTDAKNCHSQPRTGPRACRRPSSRTCPSQTKTRARPGWPPQSAPRRPPRTRPGRPFGFESDCVFLLGKGQNFASSLLCLVHQEGKQHPTAATINHTKPRPLPAHRKGLDTLRRERVERRP